MELEHFCLWVCTGLVFLVANNYRRNPRLSYALPREMRLIDAVWSIGSIILSLLFLYLISQYN